MGNFSIAKLYRLSEGMSGMYVPNMIVRSEMVSNLQYGT